MSRTGWPDRARTGALALVVFALAHNVTFLVNHGDRTAIALARAGHGEQWMAAVTLVAILALALGIAGAVRLAQLSRLASDLDGGRVRLERAGVRDLAGHTGRAWLQVLGIALLLFVGAENLEHLAVGLATPGLSVLGAGEYGSASLIFVTVALAAAFVDALYLWRRDVLIARIETARATWARSRGSSPRSAVPFVDRRHGVIHGDPISSRAPPLTAP